MTDLQANEPNPSNYWESIIANLDGSYEIYKKMRDLVMNSNHQQFEGYFEKRSRSQNMTDYLYRFDEVVEHLEYLHEQALDLEDYEFCKALVNKRLWAHYKNEAINEAIYENETY